MNWIKRNASTILTILGAVGMGATVALAIKATPKAHEKLEEKKKEVQREQLTIQETVETCSHDYIPMAATGIASLACFFGANVLSRKQQASMASAYTALASLYEGYRKQVRTICGEKTDEEMQRAMVQEAKDAEDDLPPWGELQSFYLDFTDTPEFFERTMEEVLEAEYSINRYFALKHRITVNEFMDIMHLPAVDGGDVIGWRADAADVESGFAWIDFDNRRRFTDEGFRVCEIVVPWEPSVL